MEFFRTIKINTDETTLHKELTIDRLPEFCASIYSLVESCGLEGKIFCLWGHFNIRQEMIKGGVRFTLPHCPNALAWTITTGFPPDPEAVIIHCTINRTEHDPDFIETIETFLKDWQAGIEMYLS